MITLDEKEIQAFLNTLGGMPYNQVAHLIAFIGKKVEEARVSEPVAEAIEA